MTLTREQILAAADLPRARVEVPEWGGAVCVRAMTAGQRDRFEAAVQGKKLEDIRATLVCLAACDDAGAPLFTEADIPAVSAKAAAAVNRVFEAAARLNGILPGDVEELEKN